MNYLRLIIGICLCSTLLIAQDAKKNPEAEKATVLVYLKDGSTLKGISPHSVIKLKTAYTDCQLDPLWIKRVTFNKDHSKAFLNLKNGDNLTGTLDVSTVKMQTVFGNVEIPFKHVREFRFMDKRAGLEGLQLYMPFTSETSGDASINQLPARPEFTSFKEEGKMGGSMHFNGNSFIDLGPAKLKFYDQISIASWVKLDKYPAEDSYATITTRLTQFYFRINSKGNLTSRIYGTYPSDDLVSKSVIPLNKWVHVACTYKGGQHILYIDGKLDQAANVKGLIRIDNRYSVAIGQMRSGYSKSKDPQPFTGTLDELMIFNRALPKEDILKILK